MKYYLVALFDQESYSYVEGLQKGFCKKYKVYKSNSMLHIPLEIICNTSDVEKLWEIIGNLLKPYKKFKVEINGGISFEASSKSVNLKIQNKGYIVKLARNINDILRLHGFSVREEIEATDLHISLANANHAQKEWANNGYMIPFTSDKDEALYKMPIVDRIELWKSNTNKKEPFLKSHSLREY